MTITHEQAILLGDAGTAGESFAKLVEDGAIHKPFRLTIVLDVDDLWHVVYEPTSGYVEAEGNTMAAAALDACNQAKAT